MTFDPTIPQPNDLLSDSQADLLANFSTSNAIFGKNHVNFDNSLPLLATLGYLTSAINDEGKHTIINIKMILAAIAAPTTLANEGAIYTKEVTGGGRVEAFYRYPNSGPIMQLSAIKAWATFPFGIGNVTYAINDGYNVTDITHSGVNTYQVNFTTALRQTGAPLAFNYSVFVIHSGGSAVAITGKTGNNITFTGSSNGTFYVLIVGN